MWRKGVLAGGIALVLGLLWEWLSRGSATLSLVAPPPSAILAALCERGPLFVRHAFATFKVMSAGLGLAFCCAFPLAWLMHRYQTFNLLFQPIFVVIQCVPMFALAPMMVLWFGWTPAAVVIPTALMILFPLTLNIYRGLHAAPKELVDYFFVNHATSWQTFWKLRLPSSLPHLFSGLRIGAAIAGIGAIAGEWAGAEEGLGMLMLEARRSADLETAFAALGCLTALSLSFYGCVALLQRLFEPPRAPAREMAHVSMLFVMLLLASCGSSSQHSRLLLDWLPNPNHIPLYVGVGRGFFQEEGIHLVIQKARDPGDALPLLTTGQVDFCVSYEPHLLRAAARGVPLQVAGVLIDQPLNAILYRRGEGIECPEQLTGKAIGYAVTGAQTTVLQAMLTNVAVSPSSLRNVNFDLIASLVSKRVDALYGGYWNIEGVQAAAFGCDVGVFSLAEFGVPPYQELVVAACAEMPVERIAAFKRALSRSIEECVAYPDEAFALYARLNPSKSAKTLAWEREAWHRTLPVLARSQEFNREEWMAFGAWLQQLRLIPASCSIEHLVDGLTNMPVVSGPAG